MKNWLARYCNPLNCNCSPDNWVSRNNDLYDRVISFPLAARPLSQP